jgi:hypothetical protein
MRIAECEAREVETMKRLKKVYDERDRMTEEVRSRVAGCKTREAEAMKRMNQVLADEDRTLHDRVAIEVSLMVDEVDAVKARLKEEEERIVKQRVELKEEKRRISFAKEELMRMQSEQENTRKELNEVETTMKGYGGSLDICREKLVQREKSCCEIEGALSWREQACTKQEGEIKDQVKELKMCSVVLQQEEDALTNREMLCHKNEDVLFGREQACVKQEGEIEDQVKKLKMCDVLVQQQESSLTNREILCRNNEDVLSGRELLNSDSLKGSSVKVITYLWMICFGFTWKPYAANLPRGDLKSLIVRIACLAIVCSFRT